MPGLLEAAKASAEALLQDESLMEESVAHRPHFWVARAGTNPNNVLFSFEYEGESFVIFEMREDDV